MPVASPVCVNSLISYIAVKSRSPHCLTATVLLSSINSINQGPLDINLKSPGTQLGSPSWWVRDGRMEWGQRASSRNSESHDAGCLQRPSIGSFPIFNPSRLDLDLECGESDRDCWWFRGGELRAPISRYDTFVQIRESHPCPTPSPANLDAASLYVTRWETGVFVLIRSRPEELQGGFQHSPCPFSILGWEYLCTEEPIQPNVAAWVKL